MRFVSLLSEDIPTPVEPQLPASLTAGETPGRERAVAGWKVGLSPLSHGIFSQLLHGVKPALLHIRFVAFLILSTLESPIDAIPCNPKFKVWDTAVCLKFCILPQLALHSMFDRPATTWPCKSCKSGSRFLGLEGLPDPSSIERQKSSYARGLEEQLRPFR